MEELILIIATVILLLALFKRAIKIEITIKHETNDVVVEQNIKDEDIPPVKGLDEFIQGINEFMGVSGDEENRV